MDDPTFNTAGSTTTINVMGSNWSPAQGTTTAPIFTCPEAIWTISIAGPVPQEDPCAKTK